ncbi:MAG: hypothetical protein WCD63_05515, partial [Terrimicrobiaceae bacterium]
MLSALYRSEQAEDRLHFRPSEIAHHVRGACQREGAMAGSLTRGWRGEARSTALQTRPRGWASSSATNEARAERDVHCALVSGEAQGDGAVRIEPRMRAPQIGGSRSLLIRMRGCRGSLVIDRLLRAVRDRPHLLDRIEWILARGFHEWFLKEINEGRVLWPGPALRAPLRTDVRRAYPVQPRA